MDTKQPLFTFGPNIDKAVIIVSGGLDSTILCHTANRLLGVDNVRIITFSYGQKQTAEIGMVAKSFPKNEQRIVDLGFLSDAGKGVSANVDASIPVPKLAEVLGDASPVTEVPNRNMVMLSVAAAYCQAWNIGTLMCGVQMHDVYGYWDTTKQFVDAMNEVLSQARRVPVTIVAPFVAMSKTDELNLVIGSEGRDRLIEIAKNTLSCYDPEPAEVLSCGECPTCSERLKAFKDVGIQDPIQYKRRT